MKALLILALLPWPLLVAQNPNTAVFPSAVAGDSDLPPASDNLRSTLAGNITSGTNTITISQANRFPTPILLSIDQEQLRCSAHTGASYTCTRGFNNSTAAAHANQAIVHANFTSWHYNQLAKEVESIESSLPVMVSDLPYRADPSKNFFDACAAAVAQARPLAVSQVWPAGDGTCSAAVVMYRGGSIQPNTGRTVTFAASFTAPPTMQVFTTGTGAGTVKFTSGSVTEVYPQWWGAKGDGTTDDTAALQAAMASANYPSGLYSTAELVVPSGTYKFIDTLTLGQWGMKVRGQGSYGNTTLSWQGPTNKVAVQVNGFLPHLTDIYISDDGTGWSSGIDYEGSRGVFDAVYVDCRNHPGDGITAYKLGLGQSDQLTLNRPSIFDCVSGVGMRSFQANSLDINLYNATVVYCWIGLETYIGTNMNVFGGEISENDVNFLPIIGSNMFISGTRSELSKRQLWSAAGTGAAINFTYTGNQISSYQPARATVTAAATSGTTAVTFSGPAFTFGDKINITGAGPAGATLAATIMGMSSTTAATIDQTIGTTVTTAAVSLNAAVQQYQFSTQGPGPWVFTGNQLNASGTNPSIAFQPPGFGGAGITLTGNAFSGASRTPWGELATTNPTTGIYAMNNMADMSVVNGGPFWMPNILPADTSLSARAPLNYIASETGGNNAIAGTSYIPITAGMEVTVLLAHTLQAGTNTFNYNGHGADPIKGKTGADLTTARASGAYLTLTWTGANWTDPTDTPATGGIYTAPTTFSPVLTFGGASTGITYGRQTGYYSRVCSGAGTGCTTTYWFDMILSSKGSATGTAAVSLPFAATGGNPDSGCLLSFYDAFQSTVARQVYGHIVNSTSTVTLRQAGGNGSQAALTDVNFGASSQLAMTCVYR